MLCHVVTYQHPLAKPDLCPDRHHQKTLQSLKAAKQSAEAQLASGNEGKQALQARVESLTADNSQLLARLLAAEKALAQQLQQVCAPHTSLRTSARSEVYVYSCQTAILLSLVLHPLR